MSFNVITGLTRTERGGAAQGAARPISNDNGAPFFLAVILSFLQEEREGVEVSREGYKGAEP